MSTSYYYHVCVTGQDVYSLIVTTYKIWASIKCLVYDFNIWVVGKKFVDINLTSNKTIEKNRLCSNNAAWCFDKPIQNTSNRNKYELNNEIALNELPQNTDTI